MKFDAARAAELCEKLGDPSFAGPDAETRIAEFAAVRLRQAGWVVEERNVAGSRFPQRAAPWIGWLGYGALITAAYVILLGKNLRVGYLAVFMIVPAHAWLFATLAHRIRWGQRLAPFERAPLVMARAAEGSRRPVRVVFQAILGGLDPDPFPSLRLTRTRLVIVHAGFFLAAGFTVVTRSLERPLAPAIGLGCASGLLAYLWLAILAILSRKMRAQNRPFRAEKQGLAVLLELARSWPRSGSRPIEVVFVAAGGQRLDYAGSRTVLELLESGWPRKPSLLFLLFAPGAGGEHRPVPIVSPGLPTAELASDAAKSLWIPIRASDPWAYAQLWPFDRATRTAEVIALLGADSESALDAPVAPNALDHAAQLTTEIALRWAKKQEQTSGA